MTRDYYVHPGFDPIFFSVGPLDVRWYGLMYLVGLAFAWWWGNRQADRSQQGQAIGGEVWTREQWSDLLFWGFLALIIGGRVGYVLFYQFSAFLANPLYLFDITSGGMSFHGGLLGAIVAILLYAKVKGRSIMAVGDFVAPLVPIGLGAGRIGNYINGELWGRTTDVPWAVIFPAAGPDPRHASQLYQAFFEGLLLFALLFWFSRRQRPTGAIAGLFLIGYGCARLFTEYFREPDAHLGLLAASLSMGQWLSIPMVLVGVLFLLLAYRGVFKPRYTQQVASKESKTQGKQRGGKS
ncbi:prolipoprotein diacylglyceryl transferase [Aliidiomarina sedimenti]|uniref:Phosphatidylglycerol--prolipoprotein diacylglyceryl transferase n=1 Tax=Aliidiomarina sedimenti TaxID=1933879 RepID=A0ABY0BYQ8_9GAMM|nr:prolipoprotein diacylglyceryl transferase [Aliidiomarina sedimenti]RUO29821.1 prolipoprotein diacylglyceryl transferase [Aliidiomarina sedimenti]